MKIVWICHFSNKEITSLLPLYRKVKEFAPWIPNMIREFEKRKDIDLHIIAPHYFIKRYFELKLRGIHYYFIPAGIPIYHRYYPDYLPIDTAFKYILFNYRVRKLIKKINPDIINLIGSENAYYASSIFGLQNFPIIVTIQGFISEFVDKNSNYSLRYRAKVELNILKEYKHFIGEEDSKNYITKFNNNFKFFKAYFPVNEDLIFNINNNFNGQQIKYDLVFFGRLDKLKGIFDFVKIVNELRNYRKDFKAAVTGSGEISKIKEFSKELGCEKNIDFVNFIEGQEELFKLVKSSRTFVIPTYFERLPSTLRESMLLKVPIVAYKTGGIPLVNRERENIILVDRGDYKKMAVEVLELLNNDNKRLNLIDNAFDFATREFSIKNNIENMINAYKETIKDFKL